tara:strand:+ start:1172 stop:1396 length:225 start_codon:yes stop_codon:yes gene_type:complete
VKLGSQADRARQRLLWHLSYWPEDREAEEALARLEASMRYAGGYREVLEVTQEEATKAFPKPEITVTKENHQDD